MSSTEMFYGLVGVLAGVAGLIVVLFLHLSKRIHDMNTNLGDVKVGLAQLNGKVDIGFVLLNGKIDRLQSECNLRFDRLDEKFDDLKEEVEGLDGKVDDLGERTSYVEGKLDITPGPKRPASVGAKSRDEEAA